MRLGKWVLAVAVLGLVLGGTASAQLYGPHQPNELCIHAGAQWWAGGAGNGGYGFPNHGGCKYWPSFAHFAGTSLPVGTAWPWKIDGWSWTAMQTASTSTTWYFDTALHKSMDDPYSLTTKVNGSKGMGWDYSKLICLGSQSGALPDFIWGGTLPGIVPGIGGDHKAIFPSSYGGDDSYWNFFAVSTGSVTTTAPGSWYIWIFGVAGQCTDPLTVPSSHSIMEEVWICRPENVVSEYLLFSYDEYDCTGTAGGKVGNKNARNYSITSDVDNGYYWGWFGSIEYGMCVGVCDIVTIPVNVPGSPMSINPYSGYGFDVGVATLLPYGTSGCVTLQFLSLANQSPGMNRAILGALQIWTGSYPWNNSAGTLGPFGWRLAHKWDFITGLLSKPALLLAFIHSTAPAYPGWSPWGHTGGTSIGLPMPPDPLLLCLEIRFQSYQFAGAGGPQPAGPPSAAYTFTSY